MIDNILQTSLLLMIIPVLVIGLSPDDVSDRFKIIWLSVLAFFALVAFSSALITIWAA